MTLKIYHNPRCSKSREALALLEREGAAPQIVEYLKTPPRPAALKRILKALGITAHDLVRKKEAADAGIDPAELSEKALISMMAKHPEMIERPIVVNGDRAVVGRPPARVLEVL